MQTRRFTIGGAVVFALGLLAAGCGYQFAGKGSFPAGVRKVHIALFDNRTTETGIEKVFADDFINEFIRRNEEGVATNPEDADAFLTGIIAFMGVETISRTDATTSDERRVTLIVELRLRDRKKRVIWAASVSENEAYPVAEDRFQTDRNRLSAIEVLSKRLAEKAYNRLTVDF